MFPRVFGIVVSPVLVSQSSDGIEFDSALAVEDVVGSSWGYGNRNSEFRMGKG
jgi:hypothetical protein